MGEPSRERKAETSQPPDPDRLWAEQWGAEARSYLRRVCGPEVDARVLERALDEVARLAGDGGRRPGPAAVVGIRAAIRTAALEEARRAATRLGPRLSHLVRLKTGCAKVPRRLDERTAGRLSAGDTTDLYRHLDRCQECAGLTGRLDAAEWQLNEALGWPDRSSRAAAAPSGDLTRAAAASIPGAGSGAPATSPPAARNGGPADAPPPNRLGPRKGAPTNAPAPSNRGAPGGAQAEASDRDSPPATDPQAGAGLETGRSGAKPPSPAAATRDPSRSTAKHPAQSAVDRAGAAGVGAAAPATRRPAVNRPAARISTLPAYGDHRPAAASARRRGTLAGAAVLLLLGIGLFAATRHQSPGHIRRPAVIFPSSRKPVEPVASLAAGLPGLSTGDLLLGAAPPPAPPPAATPGVSSAAAFDAILVGGASATGPDAGQASGPAAG